jgi:polygalacturonase
MEMDYYVRDYGAARDGKADDSQPIQNAIDACAENGGGRVIIGAGDACLFSVLCLKSNVELHVERGGRLLMAYSDGVGIGAEHAAPKPKHRGMDYGIVADGATNVALTGAGEVCGNGRLYVTQELAQIYRTQRFRPHVVTFFGCKDALIRDIHVLDGPSWTVTLFECYNVTIDNLTVYNDMKMPNSDALDICHCRNVRVSNSHFESGDDCIVLKTMNSTGHGIPCENVTVANCTMTSRSFAINLGCEVSAPIRNCVFENIAIVNSHRGIGVHQSRESVVENVLFSNITVETRHFDPDWWGAGEPIYIVSIPWTPKDTVGPVRNIRFAHIMCRSESGVLIYGDDGAVVDNIVLDDVWVNMEKFTDEPGGRMDLRPAEGSRAPLESEVFESDIAAFTVRNAKNVALRNCGATWSDAANGRPRWFGYALDASQAENLSIENFRGEHAHSPELGGTCVR